jgi:hypothetical protein
MEQTERKGFQPFVTRAEAGYQNVRTQSEFPSFPESQSFSTTTATSLATGSGTSTWASIDLSQLVPTTAEFAHVYFSAEKDTWIGSFDGSLDVRRDDQVDSIVYRKAQFRFLNSNEGAYGVEVFVPLTMGMLRTFDFRVNGAGSNLTNTDWSLELRGYTTRRRNVADANRTIGNGGSSTESSGGSGSGGGGFPGAEL